MSTERKQNPATGAKILIVDDNEDNRMVLADALEQEGYVLREVTNGVECLAAVAEDPPDVILLDVLMPEMDGIECCRRLKASALTRRIPVILVTALNEDQHVIDGLNAGATDYVAKPFAWPVVRARVRAALRSKMAHDRLRDQHEQIIDLAAMLERKNTTLATLTDTAHRFVDNVAHEFRTPLSVIKEFASIISDGLGGPVTDQQHEYLDFITSASRDLARMVDDFLDSSKLKARTLRVDRHAHDIASVLDSVEPMLLARAKQKRIAIERYAPDASLTAFVDAEKIVRVIVNLGINAIKFSPEGSTVRLSVVPHADGGTIISVSDQGPGLSAEDAARVFDRFKQVGDVSRSSKGFGLGLNIARELIWLNLGTMGVETESGCGSTFSFTVPANAPAMILARYVERLDELEPKPIGITVLRARTGGGRASAEELRRFLVSACYPMDLALVAGDDASVLLFGATIEADAWCERLRCVDASRAPAGGMTAALDVCAVGTWAFTDAADLVSGILPELASAERTVCT